MSDFKEEFYLGANTAKGFVSLYNQLTEDKNHNKIFVIKGGPGTGKSTIMKKVGEWFSKKGEVEYCHCSSDPDSIDVVILKNIGISVLDGTPPHIVEPKFPGAFESIVDLYPLWDEKGLEKKRREIERISKICSGCHEKAVKYISIASILSNSNMLIEEAALNKEKAGLFADRIIKKIMAEKRNGEGHESVRFLSAITPKGVYMYDSMVTKNYNNIYVLEDEYGTVSSFILDKIRYSLLKNNYEFITCYCVLSPHQKIEHIFVPEIKTAFVTSNSFHRFKINEDNHVIRTRRFLDVKTMQENKQKLKFNSDVKNEMIEQAIKNMKEAKSYHDELEKIYTSNVNFKKMDEVVDKLIKRINRD